MAHHGRVGFDVALCSGEDEAHPASELHHHHRHTTGWQSPKFSEYPQELILRMKGDTYIEQIQFLSHSSKICSKIEVYIAEPTDDTSARLVYPAVETAKFRRLGYLSLSPNDSSEYMARELKTVHVNCMALYLRLVLHKCHVNSYNYFNQIGIVALNILGAGKNTYHPSPTPYALETGAAPMDVNDGGAIPLKDMKPLGDGVGEDDARYTLQYDPVTQKKIRELMQVKQRAVQEEDYDLAKRMKVQIDALKTIGSKLLLLENQKKQAVQQEDYDLAKSLKQQIDELRTSALHSNPLHAAPLVPPPVCLPPMGGGMGGQGGPYPAGAGAGGPPPMGTGYTGASSGIYPPHDNAPATATATAASARSFPPSNPLPPLESSTAGGAPPTEPTGFNAFGGAPAADVHAPASPAAPAPPPPPGGLDDRPAVSRAYLSNMPPEAPPEDDEDDARPAASSSKLFDIDKIMQTEDPFNTATGGGAGSIMGGGGGGMGMSAAASPGAGGGDKLTTSSAAADWDRDLAERIVALHSECASLEKMPEAKQRSAAEFITCFGEFTATCLLHTKGKHRNAGIRAVAGKIAAGKGGGDPCPFPDPTQSTILFLRHVVSKGQGLNDSVVTVVNTTIDSVCAIIESKPPMTVQPAIHGVASLLVIKAADANQRTRELSTELLMLLAVSPIYGAEKVAAIVLHDPPTDGKPAANKAKLWRPLNARAVLLSLLLDKFGLNKKELRSVLTVDSMMTKVALPCVHHSNKEARDAGVKVIVQLHTLGASKALQKHLQDLKQALKDVIDKEVEHAKAPPKNIIPAEREMMSASINIDNNEHVKQQIRAARANKSPANAAATLSPRAPPGPDPSPPRQHPPPAMEDLDDETTCSFCHLHDKRFNAMVLDQHYLHSCVMLYQCHLCDQVIEVMMLTDHLLMECREKHRMKQCPTCMEAVEEAAFQEHVNSPACMAMAEHAVRCVLCKQPIGPGEEGWEHHLLKDGCPKNPRPLHNPDPPELRGLR